MKHIRDYEPILSHIMLSIAKDTRFRCRPSLAKVLEENPKLVIAFSHASPLSWLPAISLLCAHVTARGGGSRIPMGVMDKLFFSLPGIKKLAHQITQTERPLGFSELHDAYLSGRITDVIVFPEGSNCFFGKPDVLQPFRSPKFVELAIRAHSPILVCVHRGSEHWAQALPINEQIIEKLDWLPNIAYDFLESRLKRTKMFTLPLIPKPMERFEMLCELYHPTLKEEDLAHDTTERRAQIKTEADKIHQKMESMLAELDQARISGVSQPDLV